MRRPRYMKPFIILVGVLFLLYYSVTFIHAVIVFNVVSPDLPMDEMNRVVVFSGAILLMIAILIYYCLFKVVISRYIARTHDRPMGTADGDTP